MRIAGLRTSLSSVTPASRNATMPKASQAGAHDKRHWGTKTPLLYCLRFDRPHATASHRAAGHGSGSEPVSNAAPPRQAAGPRCAETCPDPVRRIRSPWASGHGLTRMRARRGNDDDLKTLARSRPDCLLSPATRTPPPNTKNAPEGFAPARLDVGVTSLAPEREAVEFIRE